MTASAHDMVGFPEARRTPRVGANFHVMLLLANEQRYCDVRDVSESGLALGLQSLERRSVYVDMDLHIPDQLRPIRAVGRRVHTRPGHFGLKFVQLGPGGRARLSRYVRERMKVAPLEDARERLDYQPPPLAGEPTEPHVFHPPGSPGSQWSESAAIVVADPTRSNALPTGRSRNALPVPKDAIAPSFSSTSEEEEERSGDTPLHARAIMARRGNKKR